MKKTGGTSFRVEIYDSIAGIDRIASDWTALEAQTPEATGFQAFAWCRSWILARQASGTPARLCVVGVYGGQGLVLLLPLEIEQQAKIAIAQWIGEPMTQYGDVLALPGQDRPLWFDAARAHLKQHINLDLFAFSRLRADGVLAQCHRGARTEGAATSAPFVDLSLHGHRDTARSRNKSMARRAKQLANFGPVLFEPIDDPVGRAAAVRSALAQKRHWLQAKGLFSAGLTHPATDAFFTHFEATGGLHVHALRVGGELAALEIGFTGGKAYRSLLGTFDARFAAGSPGHALTSLLIEKYAAAGFETFDFLAPNDAYKMAWAKQAVEVSALLEPVTIWGHAGAFALKRLKPLAKKAQAAMPPSARRALHRIAVAS